LSIFSQFWRRKETPERVEAVPEMTIANMTVGGLTGSRRDSMARERVEGGVDLQALSGGAVVEARTKNSVYSIRIGEGGRILLAGHPEHCPEPTQVVSVGSVLLTGAVCDGYLAPGMRMEFRVGTRRVFTSRLLSVNVVTGGA